MGYGQLSFVSGVVAAFVCAGLPLECVTVLHPPHCSPAHPATHHGNILQFAALLVLLPFLYWPRLVTLTRQLVPGLSRNLEDCVHPSPARERGLSRSVWSYYFKH